MFLLYDELKNRGISSKIEDIKAFSSGEQPSYSVRQVQMLRDDLYQIVRMPFLKLSRKEYLTLTTLAYGLTVAMMFLINAFIPIEKELKLTQIHWEILTATCAIVEPIITFVVPGVCYYKLSVERELK